jgi:hypothetical protein
MATGNGSAGKKENKGGRRADPISEITGLSEQALEETEDALAARRKLTQRFLREIEKEIAEALRMLRNLGQPWQRGDRTEYEFMRISLDKALTARKKERRERLLQSWRDLMELRQRRLELLRELAGLGFGRRDR